MFSKKPLTKRAVSVLLLGLLAFSFIFVLAPAKANSGIIQVTQHGKSTGTTDKLQLSGVTAGDLIVVGGSSLVAAASYSDVTNIVSVNQVPAGNFVFSDFTLYSKRVLPNTCSDPTGGVSCMSQLLVATAKSTGKMNITVTYGATTFHESFAYDLRGYTLVGVPTGYGVLDASCSNQCTTAISPLIPPAGPGAIIIGLIAGNAISSEASNTNGFIPVTNGTNYWGQSQYTGNTDGDNAVSFVNLGCAGSPCTYVETAISLAVVSATSFVTTTTTLAPSSANSSVGETAFNSGSSLTIAKGIEWFTYAQNPSTHEGFLSNVTIHIKDVDITAPSTKLMLVVYRVNQPNQIPTASTPLVLATGFTFTLANNSGSQFLHFPAGSIGFVPICGVCYWGIGLWTNSTASVGSSGSGVSFYLQTAGTQWYQFTTNGIATSVYYGNNATGISAFAFMNFGISQVTVTNTTTTTTTIANTTTTTTVSTATVTASVTINQAGIRDQTNDYVALAIIGSFFMISLKFGGMAGGIFGGILGVIVSIAGGFLTGSLASVALVATVVGAAAAIYLGRASGGGGGV